MKTEMRVCGIFASIGFLGAMVLSYGTDNPLWMLLYGLLTAIVLGFLGYRIGYIIAHPRGKKRRRAKAGYALTVPDNSAPKTASSSTLTAADTPPTDPFEPASIPKLEEAVSGDSPA